MWTDEIKSHLTEKLLPFWEGLKDEAYGGFYGYMGYDLALEKKAVKGCILNSRILWFFANAYLLLKEEELLEYGRHAYRFLREKCMDTVNGGVYWSLNYRGEPQERLKHTYNQAFAVYALSSWYAASGEEEALQLARNLYRLIEDKCTDDDGYGEAYDENFRVIDNEKLSENGVMAEKTMNTLLHVFEAYTELYRVSRDPEVGERLKHIMDVFYEKVYNRKLGRQEVFFDHNWNSLIDLYSYGHDIETAWLIDRGCEVLEDESYKEKMLAVTREITANIYKRAYRGCSLFNEAERGEQDTTRVWWVQAEAVVGFLNGYQKTPDREEYLEAAKNIWNYIKTYLVDSRPGSEWYWALDENGRPLEKPIVEPWKCPYHNGRMCMEVIRRMG